MEALTSFAENRGHKINELAIAWLLSHPWLSAIPIGVSRVEQLDADLRSLEWKLDAEDLLELNKLF